MKLKRLSNQPILASRVQTKYLYNPTKIFPNFEHWWEMRSVFNPGVVLIDNKFYILYRAQDFHFISRFGLAIYDPITNKITYRSDFPVYEITKENDLIFGRIGCEDARIIRMNGTDEFQIFFTTATIKSITKDNYLTLQKSMPYGWYDIYTAQSTTRDFQTFTKQNFVFKKNHVKDVALFPEKQNGSYLLLTRFFPSIQLAVSKDLKTIDSITTMLDPGSAAWDSEKIGVGPPPIKTDKGWLCIYHGVDKNNVYRLSYFILDLENPTKLVYHHREPILEPELSWEKEGNTPNVVFSNGAAVFNEELYVFYGAADKVVGVAKAPLKDFIENL